MRRLLLAADDQKLRRDLLTHEAWGDRLSLSQWLERERRLRSHPWAAEAMQTHFLTENGVVLSSCETFRMKVAWKGEDRSIYGVASVFTERALRGRGYATSMLELLHVELGRRDPSAVGALLFSEVGPRIYERAGYVAAPLRERILPASPGRPEVEWIAEGGVDEALARIPSPCDPNVSPTAEQIDWHLERERIYAGLMGRRRPPWAGARAGEDVVLWAADFRHDRLVVLLGHAGSAAGARRLAAAAAHAAHRAGLGTVQIWENPTLPLDGRDGVRPLDDLPMFHFFREGATVPTVIPRALWV